jgi:hypothetical protein
VESKFLATDEHRKEQEFFNAEFAESAEKSRLEADPSDF